MKRLTRFSENMISLTSGSLFANGLKSNDWFIITSSLTIFICGFILTIYKTP